MCQRSRPAVPHDSVMVENFLELGGGSPALSGCQVCLSVYIRMVETGSVVDELTPPQLDGCRSLHCIQGGSRILFIQRQLRLNRWQPKRLHLRVQRKAFS